VASYDYNFQTTQWDTTPGHHVPLDSAALILRSGLVANFYTMPRWEAVNYVMPTTSVVPVVGDTTKPGLKWQAEVVVPAQVTADTYELRFLGLGYGGSSTTAIYSYVVTDKRNDSMVLDTASFSYTVGNKQTRALPMFNGLALNCTLHLATPTKAFDSAYVVRSAQYPAESVGVRSGTAPKTGWAFRGSDYKIVWTAESGFMTAKVLDVTHGGVEVPKTRWTGNISMPDSVANGWCFVNKAFRGPSDTLTGQAADIYVCGGFITFRPSGPATRGTSWATRRKARLRATTCITRCQIRAWRGPTPPTSSTSRSCRTPTSSSTPGRSHRNSATSGSPTCLTNAPSASTPWPVTLSR
jgi:hypothetical protein